LIWSSQLEVEPAALRFQVFVIPHESLRCFPSTFPAVVARGLHQVGVGCCHSPWGIINETRGMLSHSEWKEGLGCQTFMQLRF
jgi:hypothetical protein